MRSSSAMAAAMIGVLALVGAPASCADYRDAGAPPAVGDAGPVGPGGDAETAADGSGPPADSGPAVCDYGCIILKDRPVLYLRFDEEAGTEARDSSPSGFHGQYPQAGASKGAPGIVGRAVKFSGQGPQQITMPPSLDFTGSKVAFSIELWVKRDPFAGLRFILDHERFDTRGGWLVQTEEGQLNLEMYANDASFGVAFTTDAPVTAGVWHHLVLTYDSESRMAFVWVDAKLEFGNAVEGGAMFPSVGTWSIGKQNCTPCADASYEGSIDELAVYDHLLDQATVEAHYAAGTRK